MTEAIAIGISAISTFSWLSYRRAHKPFIFDLSSPTARQTFLRQNHFSLQGGIYDLNRLVELQLESGPKTIRFATSSIQVTCVKNKLLEIELDSDDLSRDEAYSAARNFAQAFGINEQIIEAWHQRPNPDWKAMTATSNQNLPESYIVEIGDSFNDEKPFIVRVGAAWQLAR